MNRKHLGVSLLEIMISISLIAIVFIITIGLYLQAGQIFSRTSVRIEPQRSLMLAMKKMESEIREAMFIRIGSNSSMVELAMPLRDQNDMIAMSKIQLDSNGTRSTIGRSEGKHICYFLGRPDIYDTTLAVPDAIYGNTIYQIYTGNNTTTGSDIINSEGQLAYSYRNASKIISGVRPHAIVTDPGTGQEVIGPIFSYVGYNDTNWYTSKGLNSQLVRISLTVPVTVVAGKIKTVRNHTVASEFCLRNFESLN